MKRSILLLLSVFTFISCGDKNKEEKPVESKPENYSMVIDGVYEKDDNIKIFYKIGEYWSYDKPIEKEIKGSAQSQNIVIDFPGGIAPENVAVTISTNKEQASVSISNVTIKKGKLSVDGSKNKFYEYFNADESILWDAVKSRYNLNHGNKYPPSITGNETLGSLLPL